MLNLELHTGNTEKSILKGNLRHLWLELTRKCNLKCLHCYADASPHFPLFNSLKTPDWINVLYEAYDEGCRSVQFIGGEPFLYSDLESLLRIARSLGYEKIEVFTNGTMLTSRWLTIFSELQVRLALSFYSVSPETHDAITGHKGSYYRTLRAIDSALTAGLWVRVGIIQITQTDDEVERLKEFLKERGVRHIGVDRVRKIGRAAHDDLYMDPFRQLQELCGACHKGNLCVTASGVCYPCIMSRAWPVGNIRNGLSNVLRSPKLIEFREQQREFLANRPKADCNPDDCNPYDCNPWCNPNCNPFEDCVPKCWPW